MTSQNRRRQNRYKGGVSSGSKTTSQNNSAKIIPKKKEFWYQLHDGSRGNGYTFENNTDHYLENTDYVYWWLVYS